MSTVTVERNRATVYQQSAEKVSASFDADAQKGLVKEGARARLQKYGRSESLAEKPVLCPARYGDI